MMDGTAVIFARSPQLARRPRVRRGAAIALNLFAGLLLFAAGAKLKLLADQRLPLGNVRGGLGLAQIAGEWLVAAWIVSGLARTHARWVAMALLAVFTGVSGWHWAAGDRNCGCFGNLAVHPAVTFFVDLAALLLIWRLGVAPVQEHTHRNSSLRLGLAAVTGLALPVAAIWSLHPLAAQAGDQEIVVFDAASVRGKPLALLDYLDPESRSGVAHGRCTIVLFNHDCSHCQEYLTQLGSTHPENTLALDLGERGAAGAFHCPLPQLRLSGKAMVFSEVPVEIVVVDGVVEEVHPH